MTKKQIIKEVLEDRKVWIHMSRDEFKERCEKALQKQEDEILKIIDECKIHTAGALILIEIKELKQKIKQ